MSRGKLTPQDNQYKRIISDNLKSLGKNVKQIDISNKTGISKSSINGYFNGTRLPAPENVEKLATFFNVDKSEIDPRFRTSNEGSNHVAHIDLKKDPVVLSYDGKPVTEHEWKVIQSLLEND